AARWRATCLHQLMRTKSFQQRRAGLKSGTAGKTTCTCANHKGHAQRSQLASFEARLRKKLSASPTGFAMYISLMFRTKRRKIERLDFILAGAQKSGTTALHYFLSRHPDICMGDQQEIHFFDNDAMFVAEPNYTELHKH